MDNRNLYPLYLPSTILYHLIRPGGRGVRQGSAKPRTAVQICSRPPTSDHIRAPVPKRTETMNYLTGIEIILALLLSAVILIQQQGAGLGGAFGGEGNIYRSKRGVEKYLFYTTIFLGVAFFALAIISIISLK